MSTTEGDLALYRRSWREARPFRNSIVGLALLELLAVPLVLIEPVPLRLVADNVLGDQPWPAIVHTHVSGVDDSWRTGLAVATGLLVAIALVSRARTIVAWVRHVRVSEAIALAFRTRLFNHLQRLPLAYHDSVGTGDSVYRVGSDGESIKDLTVGVIPYVVALVTMAGLIAVTVSIDPLLGLVALAPSLPALVLITTQRHRSRRGWDRVYAHQSAAQRVLHDVLSSTRLVRAFGREESETERYRSITQQSWRQQVATSRVEALLDAAIGMLFTVGTALVLVVGVLRVESGAISFGQLLVVLSYTAWLYDPLEKLSRAGSEIQQSMASARRAWAVLDTAVEFVDQPGAVSLARAHGTIVFADVSFHYPGHPEHPVLERVSFYVPAGTRVGISGPSGAGKTTLVSLLTRMVDPIEGVVHLDATDLRQVRLEDLRRQFSVVLQDPVLFPTTIAENIAYARPEASEDEIRAAARAAHAEDFIVTLPDGYRTVVGERGVRLSGGQRQRISLARAFLKDAPVLVLDEPTSAVDAGTEDLIVETLDRLMVGRTTFLIAHDPRTLRNCALILEIDPVLHHVKARWGRPPSPTGAGAP